MFLTRYDIDNNVHIYDTTVITTFKNGIQQTTTLPVRALNKEDAVAHVLHYFVNKYAMKDTLKNIKSFEITKCAIKFNILASETACQDILRPYITEFMCGKNPHIAEQKIKQFLIDSGSIFTMKLLESLFKIYGERRPGSMSWKYQNISVEQYDKNPMVRDYDIGKINHEPENEKEQDELEREIEYMTNDIVGLSNRDTRFFSAAKCRIEQFKIKNTVIEVENELPEIYTSLDGRRSKDLHAEYWHNMNLLPRSETNLNELRQKCQQI